MSFKWPSLRASARVDPGLVRTGLGQLFGTRWRGLEMRIRSTRAVIETDSAHTLSWSRCT